MPVLIVNLAGRKSPTLAGSTLKCDDLLPFSGLYHCKLNIILFPAVGRTKTNNLKMFL